VHSEWGIIECWSQGVLGSEEGRSYFDLSGVYIGERGTLNNNSAEVIQMLDIEADSRWVYDVIRLRT